MPWSSWRNSHLLPTVENARQQHQPEHQYQPRRNDLRLIFTTASKKILLSIKLNRGQNFTKTPLKGFSIKEIFKRYLALKFQLATRNYFENFQVRWRKHKLSTYSCTYFKIRGLLEMIYNVSILIKKRIDEYCVETSLWLLFPQLIENKAQSKHIIVISFQTLPQHEC